MIYTICTAFQIPSKHGTILNVDEEFKFPVVGKKILLDGQTYLIKGVPMGGKNLRRNSIYTDFIDLEDLVGRKLTIVD